MISTARLFPPEYPVHRKIKGGFLFRLLRKEFVKKYFVPLSSDACSVFQTERAHVLNENCKQATEHLYDMIIPQFVRQFDTLSIAVGDESETLKQQLHNAGINIRQLNHVFFASTSDQTKKIIFTEIVARTTVKMLQAQMRHLPGTASENEYKNLIVTSLNVILSNSTDFIESELKPAILSRFDPPNQANYAIADYRLFYFQITQFFDLASQKLGVKWIKPSKIFF